MNMIAIVVTLLVVLMLVLVITNLFSKSRSTGDFYHAPYEAPPQDNDVYTHSHDSGDWGSRDTSHDQYDAGDDGGGDSGGDAGAGEGGGGSE